MIFRGNYSIKYVKSESEFVRSFYAYLFFDWKQQICKRHQTIYFRNYIHQLLVNIEFLTSDRNMLLQCLKCTLYYRSFSKLKAHKSGGPCADKLKPKNKEENPNVDSLAKSVEETKIEDDNLTLEENNEDNLSDHLQMGTNDTIKREIKTEPSEFSANIKLEPEEHEALPAKLEMYNDMEEYVPAPIVVVDSDDEYEPESDDSAPDDDDVEAVRLLAHHPRCNHHQHHHHVLHCSIHVHYLAKP